MDFFIDAKRDGMTVLEFVKKETRLSAAHLKHIKFSDRGILVNGSRVTVRRVLRAGEVLTLSVEDTDADVPREKLCPVDIPLDIAYEDGDCVVPNKSADMPTHPSHNHYRDTVANALAYRYETAGVPFVFRPVNRLDRNTSGLLLVARNRIAAGELSRAMARGEIKKEYIAILCGNPPADEGEIETYMRRTAESIIVRETCAEGEGGDYALTRYRVLYKNDKNSIVCASPVTGRTHQLRVHFASLGCAILGDELYGEPSEIIGRHALHSSSLTFPRVSDGRTQTVSAPIPEDMQRAIEVIFGASALRSQ